VRVEVREAHAFLRQRVEARRLDFAAEHAHVGEPHVIGKDDDDIRPLPLRLHWSNRGEQGGEEPSDYDDG
jgi:hypothetical protein